MLTSFFFLKKKDLQYWLEMVDQKHRYGSNLRAYHTEWKKSGTHENFFYWLDYGEGKNLEVPTCSRERLEKEQVRYLSREERQNYLVKIDKEGRLCWAKNGERITTSTEYKDSVNGIVPNDDGTPAYSRASSSSSSSSSASSIFSTGSANDPEGEHYVNHDLEKAKGVKKIKHVSAAAVLNHLLRRSVKPNSWIFVSQLPIASCLPALTQNANRLPTPHSVSMLVSSNRVPSNTAHSSTAPAFRRRASSKSKMDSYAASHLYLVITARPPQTSVLSCIRCETPVST